MATKDEMERVLVVDIVEAARRFNKAVRALREDERVAVFEALLEGVCSLCFGDAPCYCVE